MHSGRYSNVKVKYINHHNPDLVLLAADESELMRVDLTRLPSISRIHRLMRLLELEEHCTDSDQRCAEWSKSGECERNPGFMETSCRNACGFCAKRSKVATEAPCHDVAKRENCEYWSTMGECTANEGFMREQCSRACGFCKVEEEDRGDADGKDEL